MASMHGHWRKVEETSVAISLVGRTLADLEPGTVDWYLDAPVSNSGRLAALMTSIAEESGWTWTIHLVHNPDPVLAGSDDVVATADSVVLDAEGPWVDLASLVVARHVPSAWIIDLRVDF